MVGNKTHIENLDAVRGWAALIVCFSHVPPMTQPSFGAAGVWIFFVLSGFLLSISFEKFPPGRVVSEIPSYLFRRLFRIMPVYCFSIAVYALVYKYYYNDNFADWAISHLSLQKADGHFWSVKVEVIVYWVLPFILFGVSFFKCKKHKLIFLLLLSCLAYYFFEAREMMTVEGGGGRVYLYFTPFILGIVISVIRNDLPAKLYSVLFYAGFFLIFLLSLDTAIVESSFTRAGFAFSTNLAWHYSIVFYPISAFVVLGAYRGSSSLLNFAFMKSLGRCGFSFYLWHKVIIILMADFITNKYLLVVASVALTYLVSLLTYTYIESPFINLIKSKGPHVAGLNREKKGWIQTVLSRHKELTAVIVLFFIGSYLVSPFFEEMGNEMSLMILVIAYLAGPMALRDVIRSRYAVVRLVGCAFAGYMAFFASFYGSQNVSRVNLLEDLAFQQRQMKVLEAHESQIATWKKEAQEKKQLDLKAHMAQVATWERDAQEKKQLDLQAHMAQVAVWKKAAQPVPGFDKAYYLATKLAKLQREEPEWIGKDTESLEAWFKESGLTAKGHYNLYGYLEGLNPNQYFDRNEYLLAVARFMYETGKYESVQDAMEGLRSGWPQDLYQHYIKFGAALGINPSNRFCETAYLSQKLDSLRANGQDRGIKNIDELRAFFASMGITALSHYYQFGIDEGLVAVPVNPSIKSTAVIDLSWEMPLKKR